LTAAQVFYRIVGQCPPNRDAFLCDRDRGLPPRARQEDNEILYISVSTYDRRDRAEKKARRFPAIGGFVVELRIPDDAPVVVERTLDRGHRSLVADPDLLLSFCVPDSCLAVPAAWDVQTVSGP
jgi:hypothetical protein